MLKQRLITAAVLLLIFVAALLAPNAAYFGALTLLFVSLGGWEWSRLNGIAGIGAVVLALLIAGLCAACWYFGWLSILPHWIWFVPATVWVVSAPVVLRGGTKLWLAIPQNIRWLVGIFVLCAAWGALWQAKLYGNNFLLSVLMLVWVADSGAYFGGKAFGKHKLAPTVSPGKSVEGAVCGLAAVLIMALAWLFFDRWYLAAYSDSAPSLYSTLLRNWSWWGLLLATIFLSVMSIVGDLSESLMKRSVGMKDSSHILPGHGGILDRTDALLPVLPLAIMLVQLGA